MILLVTLLYDLCDGLIFFKLNGRSEYLEQEHDQASSWRQCHEQFFTVYNAILNQSILIG